MHAFSSRVFSVCWVARPTISAGGFPASVLTLPANHLPIISPPTFSWIFIARFTMEHFLFHQYDWSWDSTPRDLMVMRRTTSSHGVANMKWRFPRRTRVGLFFSLICRSIHSYRRFLFICEQHTIRHTCRKPNICYKKLLYQNDDKQPL